MWEEIGPRRGGWTAAFNNSLDQAEGCRTAEAVGCHSAGLLLALSQCLGGPLQVWAATCLRRACMSVDTPTAEVVLAWHRGLWKGAGAAGAWRVGFETSCLSPCVVCFLVLGAMPPHFGALCPLLQPACRAPACLAGAQGVGVVPPRERVAGLHVVDAGVLGLSPGVGTGNRRSACRGHGGGLYLVPPYHRGTPWNACPFICAVGVCAACLCVHAGRTAHVP